MEERQHTFFLRDGRQALEGKLNLSKDATRALRKDWRFVSKHMYTELALGPLILDFYKKRFFCLWWIHLYSVKCSLQRWRKLALGRLRFIAAAARENISGCNCFIIVSN